MPAWSKWLGGFALATCIGVPAMAADPVEGEYSRGSVDSIEQLLVLPNHSFCYALAAGNLDLLAWGKWERVAGQSGAYALREIKKVSVLYPMAARHSPDIPNDEVQIEFMGYAMSRAESPVFAVSADDATPAQMKLLFPADQHEWSSSYKLPRLKKSAARYLYIGNAQSANAGDDVHGLRAKPEVIVYRLPEGVNQVRFGYDSRSAMEPINFDLRLSGDELVTADGERGFRKRGKAIPAGNLDQIEKNCRPQDDGDDGSLVKPLRTFTMTGGKVAGQPFFPANESK